MAAGGDSGKGGDTDAAALLTAVAEVSRDLKLLSSRVAELSVAAESIAAGRDGGPDGHMAVVPGQSRRASRSRIEEITVTVRPLPELAMAAMAETSLRGLPGVKQVVSVERFEGWARFTLQVVKGTDLITEMRTALPVAFTSEQSDSREISLVLEWAWGTPQ